MANCGLVPSRRNDSFTRRRSTAAIEVTACPTGSAGSANLAELSVLAILPRRRPGRDRSPSWPSPVRAFTTARSLAATPGICQRFLTRHGSRSDGGVRALLYDEPVTASRYLRYPHLRGELLTFIAADDVWRAPADGGRAWRISADQAAAAYPRLSPDGGLIAWTSWRDGTAEIFLAAPGEGSAAGGP